MKPENFGMKIQILFGTRKHKDMQKNLRIVNI